MKYLAFALAFSLLFLVSAFGQAPVTGLPPFGSFQSAGFDTVNLHNLNVNFSIPIVSVSGRGTNFSFPIVFNSSLWQISTGTPGAVSPVLDASGAPSWGWRKDIYGGVTTFRKVTQTIKCTPSGNGTLQVWSNFSFRDPLDNAHAFTVRYSDSSCDGTSQTGSTSSTDGSGYVVNITDPDNPITTSPGGLKTPSAGSAVDSNGNLISKTVVNASENDWTDTAGHIVLKVITNATSIQYQFQDTTGAYQTTTLNLSPYTIKTNFGCASVTDYTGTTTVNLPASLVLPNGKQYTFGYEQTPGSGPGFTTGRVQRVTLPTGGYYEFDFTGPNDGINCADGTTLNMTRIVNDGTTSASWLYSAVLNVNPAFRTTVTAPALSYDAAANQTVLNFDSNAHETSRKIYQGSSASGVLLRTIGTTRAANGTPSSVVTTLEDGITHASTSTTYDNNGNLTYKADYDWGTTTTGPLLHSTRISYLSTTPYVSRNIVNRPVTISVVDASNVTQYRQDISYDEASYINSSCPTGAAQHDDIGYGCSFTVRGNPTSVTTYKTPSTPANGVTKHIHYDWFGNATQADMNCCQSGTWTYSGTTQYAYPDSATTGASGGPQLTQSYTYNPYTGQVASTTNENNKTTSFAYDFLKRLLSVTRPDTVQITHAYDDTLRTVTETTPITSSTSVKHIGYGDGLGRAIKSVTADVNSTSYSITEQQYDPLGRTYKTSNPHNSTAQYWTTTQFDALGRVTQTALPDGNKTTFAYATNTTTVTDPAGKQRKTQMDGIARLTALYEPDIAHPTQLTQQTSYSYTTLDELTGVTQGAQTRTYLYDNLGRMTSATTPEAGQVQYQYSDFDLMTQRTDARGVITTYGYDTLNRLHQISYNVGATGVPATPTVTYNFGTSAAQNNNGRLLSITDGPGSETYTYDILGRTTQLQKVISGTSYTVGYGYNLSSEPTSLTYPSLRVVQRNYDAIGRPCAIAASTTSCTSNTTPYATGFGYNTAFETTGFNYGNGVAAAFTYSPDRLQLQNLGYTEGATNLFSVTYGYAQPGGNNGQIASITDTAQTGRTETFSYDPLRRLSTAGTTGSTAYPQWGLSWTYDRYGNRTAQAVTAGSAPANSLLMDSANNNRIASPYLYDAGGNLTVEPLTISNSYTYNGENQMVNFASGSTSAAYSYDCKGLRVKKVLGAATTVYVFSGPKVIAEYANGSLSKEYVYSGQALLATIAGGVTTYHQADVLSPRLSTNSSGVKAGEQGHFPFGESWYAANTTTKWQFTGYERDSESGNDYAMARYDVNRIGRFSSPDPLSRSGGDPQSWNRYAYVENDPVNATDPSGLLMCTSDPCRPGDSGYAGDPGGIFSSEGGGGGGELGGEMGDGSLFNFNISFGPNGVSFGAGFNIPTDCMGVPCDTRVSQELRQIAQAINAKNWGALVGIITNPISQYLWSQVPNPLIMDVTNNGNNCTPGTTGCFNVPTAWQMLESKLNKFSCDFMASGVQFGKNGVKAGKQALAAGGVMVGGSVLTGPFAPATATAGGLVAAGGGVYIPISFAYEAFWQGSGYISGCNAYGYSF